MLPRHSKRSSRGILNARGSYVLEFAIGIPFFLVVVIGIIDLTRIAVGFSAVRSAAHIGARRGAALQRIEWGVVRNTFNWTGSIPGNPNAITPGEFSTAINASPGTVPAFRSTNKNADWYSCMALGAGPDCDGSSRPVALPQIYRIEARAISTANTVMVRNLGNIEYPCDADFPPPGGNGEPGCGRCFTKRGGHQLSQCLPHNAWLCQLVRKSR